MSSRAFCALVSILYEVFVCRAVRFSDTIEFNPQNATQGASTKNALLQQRAAASSLVVTIEAAELYHTGNKEIGGNKYDDVYYLTIDSEEISEEPFKTEAKAASEPANQAAALLWNEKAFLNEYDGRSALRFRIYQKCAANRSIMGRLSKRLKKMRKKECVDIVHGEGRLAKADFEMGYESELLFHSEMKLLTGKVEMEVQISKVSSSMGGGPAEDSKPDSKEKEEDEGGDQITTNVAQAAAAKNEAPTPETNEEDESVFVAADDEDESFEADSGDEDENDNEDSEESQESQESEDSEDKPPAGDDKPPAGHDKPPAGQSNPQAGFPDKKCDDWTEDDLPDYWEKVSSRRRPGKYVYKNVKEDPEDCHFKRVSSVRLACKYTLDPDLC